MENTKTTAANITVSTGSVTEAKTYKVNKYERHSAALNIPDAATVNKNIDDYNTIYKDAHEFNVLPKLLDKILRLKQYELKDYLYSILKGHGYDVRYEDGYLFAKGNVPIMLCAHMDTVHKEPVQTIWMSNTGMVWSPQGIGGDDRCGIYTILMNIKEDVKPYILFTENEEIGCVGAGYFADDIANGSVKDVDVNFIVEIDRKNGNDSVYYDCDNPEFEEYINRFGFKTAWGSCSDISYVAPALGVAAVNLSSGYYDQHTLSETICLAELYNIVGRVEQIISDVAENGTAKFEYIEATYSYKNKYSGWYDYSDYNYSYGNKVSNAWEEGEEYVEKIVSPIELGSDAVIVLDNGEYISEDNGEIYFIDENNRLYMAIDTIGDSADFIVVPIRGMAYTAQFTPYKFNYDLAEMVYVDYEIGG